MVKFETSGLRAPINSYQMFVHDFCTKNGEIYGNQREAMSAGNTITHSHSHGSARVFVVRVTMKVNKYKNLTV